jgi:DNA primase
MNETEKFVGFDTLKRSVSMRQILERYGILDRLRHGGDSLSGPCPLHNGHNPTQFRVSLSKNCWICFGDCHGGGSIVDFVSRKEGIGIRDAGKLIQEWFSVTASSNPPPKPLPPVPPVERGSNPPLTFSLGSLDNQHPYLLERGLKYETIHTFGVGYCSRGWLNGWIAIPIHNAAGKLVAYAGRWPGETVEGMPKYKLPRGFKKSLELFNQHRAKKADQHQPLVIVEGYFSCLRLWQAGHRRVVALMGSMLSPAQEEAILQTAKASEVVLLFDGDAAGRNGAAQVWDRLSQKVPVRIVRLADGQQPDDLDDAELLNIVQSREEVAA